MSMANDKIGPVWHACYDCGEACATQCDNCDRWFCEDHGWRGGDREVQDVGLVAYPSMCDKCRENRRP